MIFTAGLGVIFTAGLGVIFTAGLGVISTAGLGVIFTAGLGVIFTAGRVVTFTAGLGIVQVVWFHARVSGCGTRCFPQIKSTICFGLPCPNGPIWDGLGIECHRTRENWTT